MPLIKLTQPLPTVHLLTLSSPPDNRLTPTLLSELSSHLDTIEAHWRSNGGGEMDPKKRDATDLKGAGAVVITSECKGFFSTGLDWEKSIKNPKFFESESRSIDWTLTRDSARG
jgi:enoyl-CoA hydratase/carnithine racemase